MKVAKKYIQVPLSRIVYIFVLILEKVVQTQYFIWTINKIRQEYRTFSMMHSNLKCISFYFEAPLCVVYQKERLNCRK